MNMNDPNPILLKAGDTKVLINGEPLKVDARIVAEDYYQELLASRDSRQLSAVPSELLSVMMSTRKTNTPEWLEFLTEEMNKALEKLGETDRVYYDEQRDIIRKRGIAR